MKQQLLFQLNVLWCYSKNFNLKFRDVCCLFFELEFLNFQITNRPLFFLYHAFWNLFPHFFHSFVFVTSLFDILINKSIWCHQTSLYNIFNSLLLKISKKNIAIWNNIASKYERIRTVIDHQPIIFYKFRHIDMILLIYWFLVPHVYKATPAYK